MVVAVVVVIVVVVGCVSRGDDVCRDFPGGGAGLGRCCVVLCIVVWKVIGPTRTSNTVHQVLLYTALLYVSVL